jgi:uncharacterized iron-regulated membrane protein
VALALPLLLLVASGSLLLFKDPLFVPQEFELSIGSQWPAGRAQAEIAALLVDPASRDYETLWLASPRRPFHTLVAADGTARYRALVGSALPDRGYLPQRVERGVLQLHVDLLAGDAGKWLVRVVGPLAVLLVIAGLMLWWPLRGGWRARDLRPRGSTRPALLRWHLALGAAIAAFALLQFGSGALLAHNAQIRLWLQPLAPAVAYRARELPVFPAGDARAAAQAVFALYPDATASQLIPLDDSGREQWRVKLRLPGERHPNGRSYVVVDVAAGRITQAYDARLGGLPALYDDWLYGWHIARLWGLPQAFVWLLASLAIATLAVAGVSAFARRSRAR